MRVGVYGLGRFGYFWASVLGERYETIAYTRNPDKGAPPGVKRVYHLEELARCDALFLCVAISSIEPALQGLLPFLKKKTQVIDTCSVKTYPLEIMKDLLPSGQPILGTHPMFGPDSGKHGIKGLPIVITEQKGFESVADLWVREFEAYNLKIITMSAEEHDKQAAYTQGITHFIGRVLGELDLKSNPIGTAGYNSLLEIIRQTCNDPWQLFVDLQRRNPYTRQMQSDLDQAFRSVLGRIQDKESL